MNGSDESFMFRPRIADTTFKVSNHVYAVLSLFSSGRPGCLPEETPAEAAEKPSLPGGE